MKYSRIPEGAFTCYEGCVSRSLTFMPIFSIDVAHTATAKAANDWPSVRYVIRKFPPEYTFNCLGSEVVEQ